MVKLAENRPLIFISCITLTVILIIFYIIGWFKPVANNFSRIFIPVQERLYILGSDVASFFRLLGSIKDLNKENKELREKLSQLTVKNVRLFELERENKMLRSQMGFFQEQSFKLLPCFVVAQDPNTLLDFININRGENDGIKKEMAVVASDGILVGKVSEVQKDSSKVLLITNANSSVSAMVQESRATGVVQGEYGLRLVMNLIPQDKEVKEGNFVITSGLDKEIPEGLVMGEVEKVEISDNDLFQKAKIKSPIDFKELEMVFVVLK